MADRNVVLLQSCL